jgi:alginate O-acetyltransferase complex protein AlgI
MRQFVIGLAQKVLIANTVAVPADQIFALKPDELGTATAWLGVLCYTLQIYFDFAGYSNMAIGMGRMMGFRYPENFNLPYAAVSITDFWRRWHMTLSRWFRDYLYVPLGGSRRGPFRTYLNLMIVFLLCGLWHGANWTFIAWGAWHGVFLVLERLGLGPVIARTWSPVRHGYTLAVVMIGWVLFRAETLTHAGGYLRSLCGTGGQSLLYPVERYATPTVIAALATGVVLATLPMQEIMLRIARGSALRAAGNAMLLVLLALSMLGIAGGAYNPFIYYRF